MDRHNQNTTHEGTQDRGVPRGDHVAEGAQGDEGSTRSATASVSPERTGGGQGPTRSDSESGVSDGLGEEVGPATPRQE